MDAEFPPAASDPASFACLRKRSPPPANSSGLASSDPVFSSSTPAHSSATPGPGCLYTAPGCGAGSAGPEPGPLPPAGMMSLASSPLARLPQEVPFSASSLSAVPAVPSPSCYLPSFHPPSCTCRLEVGSCGLCPVPCCYVTEAAEARVSLLEFPLSHRLRAPPHTETAPFPVLSLAAQVCPFNCLAPPPPGAGSCGSEVRSWRACRKLTRRKVDLASTRPGVSAPCVSALANASRDTAQKTPLVTPSPSPASLIHPAGAASPPSLAQGFGEQAPAAATAPSLIEGAFSREEGAAFPQVSSSASVRSLALEAEDPSAFQAETAAQDGGAPPQSLPSIEDSAASSLAAAASLSRESLAISCASSVQRRSPVDVAGMRVSLFEGLFFGRIIHRGFSNTVCFCSWTRPINLLQVPRSVSYVNRHHLLLPAVHHAHAESLRADEVPREPREFREMGARLSGERLSVESAVSAGEETGETTDTAGEPGEAVKRLVVKVTHKERLTSSVELLRARHEVLLLQELDHPNVLPLLLAGEDDREMFMFFDFATCGDLYSITKMKTFDEAVVRGVCAQILKALQYIHHKGVIHCDIKPHNLLVFRTAPEAPQAGPQGTDAVPPVGGELELSRSEPALSKSLPAERGEKCYGGSQDERDVEMHGQEPATSLSAPALISRTNGCAPVAAELDKVVIKVCDFGLAQHFQRGQMIQCDELRGSHGYLAPELLRRKPYDERIDLWAVGIIVFTMIGGYEPFYPPSECINAELEFDDRYWGCVSDEAKDFISRLLEKNPQERLHADEALEHPWFANGP
ncbi:putative protein kinase [Toxoplasma gondii VAND]|uniref:Protein kinase domain-containing protein n=1 Tax=Toxoplasma gondii VAND TaxID=933077 RepID=A0A086QCT8_TOXGO|nr:putative protein kinase [Toxoplasma gondii VAND]